MSTLDPAHDQPVVETAEKPTLEPQTSPTPAILRDPEDWSVIPVHPVLAKK